jgi:hypothetical protein
MSTIIGPSNLTTVRVKRESNETHSACPFNRCILSTKQDRDHQSLYECEDPISHDALESTVLRADYCYNPSELKKHYRSPYGKGDKPTLVNDPMTRNQFNVPSEWSIAGFMQAMVEEKLDAAQEFLLGGVHINSLDKNGHTALVNVFEECIWPYNIKAVTFLLEHGCDVNIAKDITPFEYAINIDMNVAAKISKLVDPNVTNLKNETALHVMVKRSLGDRNLKGPEIGAFLFVILKHLLKNTEVLDARDHRGETALMGCVNCIFPEAAYMIAVAGADIALKNLSGKTVLDLISELNIEEAVITGMTQAVSKNSKWREVGPPEKLEGQKSQTRVQNLWMSMPELTE